LKPAIATAAAVTVTLLLTGTAAMQPALASPGPVPAPPTPAIREPLDMPFPGVVTLSVTADDTDHRIVRVRETIPVPPAAAREGELVLLYPKWVPGGHAPEGPIDRLAGLTVTADGTRVSWKRDVADVHAFHVPIPAGAKSLEVSFQYLSPVSDEVGGSEITSTIMTLEWLNLVIYPAGWFTRDIPVDASLTLPQGWSFATALETAGTSGATHSFHRVPLETLVDSPVYAGRYARQVELDPGGPARVTLNVFGDRKDDIEIKPDQLTPHKSLVQQAYRLFGAHHYDHYDFLFSVSDNIPGQGLEHHRSSEDGEDGEYFSEYDKRASARSLLPHEFTHSWNGKFRRPADLWTPNYNVPMRNSLLWVYEGQTEYWGEVLTARTGLRTPEQARESLALIAAYFAGLPGRQWRALQDTTNDEIINPRRPMSWRSWQRFEDYYDEGQLIWLDADTLIREKTGGKKSLDDFARAFFGIDNGSYTPVTYTFDDVVRTLNGVVAHDWADFLRSRVQSVGRAAPLDGIRRGGYRLVFTEDKGDYQKDADAARKVASFAWSLGVIVGKEGVLKEVVWDSPAFRAGLAPGMTLLAVGGRPYTDQTLSEAITEARGGKEPLELIIKTADRYKVSRIDYHDGLRYPHLVRDPSVPARLDDILAAKK
jgi:predicted metalloprotease with PDZ domain